MVRDPNSSSRFAQNKRSGAQLSNDQGSMMNRNLSRTNGFQVHNAFNQMVGSTSCVTYKNVIRFTKDKRPVSSHGATYKRKGSRPQTTGHNKNAQSGDNDPYILNFV